MAVKRIGLLGGSFDPVHLAHIALAKTAYLALQLDEVQLIPAANPWQRGRLVASGPHRLAMLELATRGQPCLRVNPIEIERGGSTYTIETIEQLPQNARYSWLLGADQLTNFCTWHRWEDIAQLVELVVAQRPGSTLTVPAELAEHLAAIGCSLKELPMQPMPVSSSEIRERLQTGQPADDLLDGAVAQYIKQNHLYQPPTASAPAV